MKKNRVLLNKQQQKLILRLGPTSCLKKREPYMSDPHF